MNKREIMGEAWREFREGGKVFGECLRTAWAAAKRRVNNEAIIEAAKVAAGVTETVKTWYGWKQDGFEVRHGSKALFGVELTRHTGKTYKASFFGASQVQAIA